MYMYIVWGDSAIQDKILTEYGDAALTRWCDTSGIFTRGGGKGLPCVFLDTGEKEKSVEQINYCECQPVSCSAEQLQV